MGFAVRKLASRPARTDASRIAAEMTFKCDSRAARGPVNMEGIDALLLSAVRFELGDDLFGREPGRRRVGQDFGAERAQTPIVLARRAGLHRGRADERPHAAP